MLRVLFAALFLASPMVCPDIDPAIKCTLKRSDDQARVVTSKENTLVSIHSPFGISEAVMERTGECWPERVVLKLHLKGLERLSVVADAAQIHAAYSSTGGGLRTWKGDDESMELDACDPLAFKVDAKTTGGKVTRVIPLQDGFFEVRLPRALFERNPAKVTVKWIDFYRN